MSGCFPDSKFPEYDWTICGKCLLRVPLYGDHLCEIMQQLKKNFNDTLSAIQKDILSDAMRINKLESKLEIVYQLTSEIKDKHKAL